MTTDSKSLSIQDVTTDGFWTLYLSVIFLVIVITVATLLRPPPATVVPIPTHAERASFGITVVPLPLGNIDSLDPTTIGVITSMVTNHNLTAKILVGGDPASSEALKTAKNVESTFEEAGVSTDYLKAFVSPSLTTNTAEVHFRKASK